MQNEKLHLTQAHPGITQVVLRIGTRKAESGANFTYVSRCRCSICPTYYEKTLNLWCSVSQLTRSHALIAHGIFIPKGSTCCKKHFDNDRFTVDSIHAIKNVLLCLLKINLWTCFMISK